MSEGIKIQAYIGSVNMSAMGRRVIRLDIPEDQAIPFLAAMTMYGKLVELTMREVEEKE